VNQENQKLFAISLVPEGNIRRIVDDARTAAFRQGGSTEFIGLPAAVYLGFFKNPHACPAGAPPGTPVPSQIRESLAAQSESFFSLFPLRLLFSRIELVGNSRYIMPDPAIPPEAYALADRLADGWGLCRAADMDYPDSGGFFVSRDVTPESFGAFSFYHFAMVVYRLETEGASFSAVRWQAVAKVARKKKSGKTRQKAVLPGSKSEER